MSECILQKDKVSVPDEEKGDPKMANNEVTFKFMNPFAKS